MAITKGALAGTRFAWENEFKPCTNQIDSRV